MSRPLLAGNIQSVSEDFGDRVWRAYLALPRDENGEPPAYAKVEEPHGIAYATLSKIINGERRQVQSGTLAKLAAALGVSANWLATGESPPSLPPPDRPRPHPGKRGQEPTPARTVHYDSEEAWREVARRAGHDPDDPNVATAFQAVFKNLEGSAIEQAERLLSHLRAAEKGKALGARPADDLEAEELAALKRGKKKGKGRK